VVAAGLLLAASACVGSKPESAVIGEAFAGPAVLNIRTDIPLDSPIATTVKHGDRLEILGRRRRFLRVRTASRVEGWTDGRQLLAAEEMNDLKELAGRAASLPVQAQATTYGDLNLHTQPARQSPSFIQMHEKDKVDVLAHVTLPRTELQRKPLIPPAEKKPKAPPRKHSSSSSRVPPPPMPKPPPVVPNWLELSRSEAQDEPKPVEVEVEAPPAPTDDWSLVRVASGQSGWVLTRRLVMAIPDDVAQYAEGRRIVTYASLGAVVDGGEKKHTWLWTTVGGRPPYDFESLRVFMWSLGRHRYETAYIERNLKGYLPVLLDPVAYGTGENPPKYPGFSVCVETKDGQRSRRSYALLGNAVRFAGERPCEAPQSLLDLTAAPPAKTQDSPHAAVSQPGTPGSKPRQGLAGRVKARVKQWFGRK
jgi:hypothetical protein